MDLRSNEPFWLVKNGIIQSYNSLREDKSCDILVVGSGITGSLMAYQCIEEGFSTILIDKREVANGSSSATTSMLQYEIDVPLFELSEKIGKEGAEISYQACSQAINQLEDISKKIKSKAGFKKKNSLYFAAFKKDVDKLKKECKAREGAGFEVKWMTAEQISKKYQIENTFGGILSTQGASIDAFRFVHELLGFSVQKGLEVYDQTKLVKVKNKSDGVEASLDTGVKIKAKKIIYCTGYESTEILPEKFVNLISTYVIVSESDPELYKEYGDLLIWNTADPYIYMRTTDDGRMLVGGEDERFVNPKKRDNLIHKKQTKLLKSFQKYIRNRPFYPDFAWAGTFGETQDGLPYIGTHKEFPNSYFVLGFGGNGITFSVAGMEMVSHWLKDKRHPLSKWFKFGRRGI